MGQYLNPGNDNFKINLNGKCYVDKTELIQFLNSLVNTPQRFVSVSRPRRFGKTFAADMVCAYYDRTAESRSLFERTLLPQCEPVVVGGEENCSRNASPSLSAARKYDGTRTLKSLT